MSSRVEQERILLYLHELESTARKNSTLLACSGEYSKKEFYFTCMYSRVQQERILYLHVLESKKEFYFTCMYLRVQQERILLYLHVLESTARKNSTLLACTWEYSKKEFYFTCMSSRVQQERILLYLHVLKSTARKNSTLLACTWE